MEVKLHGGPNQTSVEKGGDELWIGEKFQSNPEIAGSPRNSFRASLRKKYRGGRALTGLGALYVTETYQTPNTIDMLPGSQTVRDKFHSRKGKSPDHRLRSPNTD